MIVNSVAQLLSPTPLLYCRAAVSDHSNLIHFELAIATMSDWLGISADRAQKWSVSLPGPRRQP